MATVTINDLQCGVTYNITAEGALNGTLVGPKSPHGNVTAGPCPVTASERRYSSTLCYTAIYIIKCVYMCLILTCMHTYSVLHSSYICYMDKISIHACFSIRIYVVYIRMHFEVKISKHTYCVATHIASQMLSIS